METITNPMYTTFSDLYDQFYRSKSYLNESIFLQKIFTDHQVRTVLDVGCGTGNHMMLLEKLGYTCTGMDISPEMVKLAAKKVRGSLFVNDMRHFSLQKTFDAVISMFAVFNHNLSLDDAKRTLSSLKKHIRPGGIAIIDLYNPQGSGEKSDLAGHDLTGQVKRVMRWDFRPDHEVCMTTVSFVKNELVSTSQFPLRIFPLHYLESLFLEAGFHSILLYDNYTFAQASPLSKNVIVLAT